MFYISLLQPLKDNPITYCRYHPGGTAIAISSSGSWFYLCLLFVYQKRKKGVVKVGLSIGP